MDREIDPENRISREKVAVAMADDENRLPAKPSIHRGKEPLRRRVVEALGGLIEYADRGFLQQRPRNGEPLRFSDGHLTARLTDNRVQPVGQGHDQVSENCRLEDRPQLVVLRSFLRDQEVLPNRRMEKVRGLRGHGEEAPRLLGAE